MSLIFLLLDAHKEMFSIKDFAALLLWPLAGPEEFDEEDNEKLPLDLQYLEAEKQRESDSYVRLSLLNAILQVCQSFLCVVHANKLVAVLIS